MHVIIQILAIKLGRYFTEPDEEIKNNKTHKNKNICSILEFKILKFVGKYK